MESPNPLKEVISQNVPDRLAKFKDSSITFNASSSFDFILFLSSCTKETALSRLFFKIRSSSHTSIMVPKSLTDVLFIGQPLRK